MVNPKYMCNRHLLSEHVEHHMIIGTLKKKKSIAGYVRNNLLEPLSLLERHEELKNEMVRRGLKHKSEIDVDLKQFLNYLPKNIIKYKINKKRSFNDLISRCKKCDKNFKYKDIVNKK